MAEVLTLGKAPYHLSAPCPVGTGNEPCHLNQACVPEAASRPLRRKAVSFTRRLPCCFGVGRPDLLFANGNNVSLNITPTLVVVF